MKIREIDLLRQISDRSHLPWRKEQEDIDELARLVENLKRPTDRSGDEENN
jgi:hypothetical protein